MAEYKNIYQKLTAVQDKLEVPKNQYNNFGKYKYRSSEDIMVALKPLLDKHGLSCFREKDYIEQIGERYYLVSVVKLVDNDTKEEITVEARAREEDSKKGMDGSQLTGSTSSYAIKYALNGLFLIDDNKDADTDEFQNQTRGASGNGRATKATKPQEQQVPSKEEAIKAKLLEKVIALNADPALVQNWQKLPADESIQRMTRWHEEFVKQQAQQAPANEEMPF